MSSTAIRCAIVDDVVTLRFMHLRQPPGRACASAAAPLFAPLELVDVRYPSADERAAVEEVRQHPPDLAAIATSALADAQAHPPAAVASATSTPVHPDPPRRPFRSGPPRPR